MKPSVGQPLIGFSNTDIRKPSLLPSSPFEQSSATPINVTAIIEGLSRRLQNLEKAVDLSVPSDQIVSRLLLTKEAALLTADKIAIVGDVTFLDYIRDQSGEATGEIDPKITKIIGDKIRSGQIISNNWDSSDPQSTVGSRFDLLNGTIQLGGVNDPHFSVDTEGNLTAKSAVFDGSISADSLIFTGDAQSPTTTESFSDLSTVAHDALTEQKLEAGIGSIAAGTGSDYQLDVNEVGSYIFMHHKDADFSADGTAGSYAGDTRTGLFISSSGIALGYNDPTDGSWTNAVAVESTGDITITGTLTANSVIAGDVTIDGTAVTMSEVVNLASTPSFTESDLVDVLEDETTTIQVNSTNLIESKNGNAGVVIGSGGITATDVNGDPTFTLNASDGNATFKGDITGASGTFSGIVSGGSILIGSNFSVSTTGVLNANSGTFSGDITVGGRTLQDISNDAVGVTGDDTGWVLSLSGTSIIVDSPNLFKMQNNLAGVVMGSGGIVATDSGGVQTFSLNASNGDAEFSGKITGGSSIYASGSIPTNDINLTIGAGGSAVAVSTVGYFRNPSLTSGYDIGVVGRVTYLPASPCVGVLGIVDNSTGTGGNAVGVVGYSKNGWGMWAKTDSGTALYVQGDIEVEGQLKFVVGPGAESSTTFTQTHRFQININGTDYWLSLDAV